MCMKAKEQTWLRIGAKRKMLNSKLTKNKQDSLSRFKNDIITFMTRKTNISYFTQTYYELSKITASALAEVKVSDSMHEHANTKSISSQFHVDLQGPFIFFTLNKIENQQQSSMTNFFLFTLFYMWKYDSANCSLDFLPSYRQLTMRLTIFFKTNNEALDFQTKLRKAYSYCFTPNIFIPPLMIPIFIYDKTKNEATELELSAQNGTINFADHSNVRVESFTITEMTGVISISPFHEFPDNFRSISFSFLQNGWERRACICQSKDILEFTFLTLFLSTCLSYIKQRHELTHSKAIKAIAQPIPDPRKLNTSLFFPFNPKNKEFDPFLHIHEKEQKVSFIPVTVPSKASSKLELLSFDFPIQRNLFIYRNINSHGNSKITKKQKKEKTFIPRVFIDFNTCVKRISNKEISVNDNFAETLKTEENNIKLFDFIDLKEKTFFQQNGDEILLNFMQKKLFSPNLHNYAEKIGFSLPQTFAKFNGFHYGNQIGKLVIEISDSTIDLSNPKFYLILTGISLLFIENTNKENINHSFRSLLEKNQRFKSYFPLKPTENEKFSFDEFLFAMKLFFCRLFISHLFSFFLEFIIKENNWRYSTYLKLSPLLSTDFIEHLQIVTQPIQNSQFIGHLNTNLLKETKWENYNPKNPVSVSESFVIRDLIENLHHMILSDNRNEENIHKITENIISEIINFFKKGFKIPSFSPFPTMRHPWYVFVIGSSLEQNKKEEKDEKTQNSTEETPKIGFSLGNFEVSNLLNRIQNTKTQNRDNRTEIEKMKDAVETLSALLSDPDEMLHSLLFEGLRKGLLGHWVLAAAVASKEENLYEESAPISDKEEMIAFIDPLFETSTISFYF